MLAERRQYQRCEDQKRRKPPHHADHVSEIPVNRRRTFRGVIPVILRDHIDFGPCKMFGNTRNPVVVKSNDRREISEGRNTDCQSHFGKRTKSSCLNGFDGFHGKKGNSKNDERRFPESAQRGVCTKDHEKPNPERTVSLGQILCEEQKTSKCKRNRTRAVR